MGPFSSASSRSGRQGGRSRMYACLPSPNLRSDRTLRSSVQGEAPAMTVNAQYNIAKPDSLPVRVAAYQRKKMFAAFVERSGIATGATLLDVGATGDRTYDHSNYLEA